MMTLATIPFAVHGALHYFEKHASETPRPEVHAHMSTLIDEYERLSALVVKHVPHEVTIAAGFRAVVR